eukprot:jgi/Ulvmu1/1234/UM109_0032.1
MKLSAMGTTLQAAPRPALHRQRAPVSVVKKQLVTPPVRTLLIDNYDSYTYNLYQLISDVSGVLPVVVANDHVTAEQVEELIEKGHIHNIVISPGPGTPTVAEDVGVVPQVLQHFADVPILGVCLGHQALADVHGASVVRAPEPCHGRLSDIQHNGHELFLDIPSGKESGFRVVRYHSLVVEEESLPSHLQPICWTAGGDVSLTVRDEELQSSSSDDKLLMGIAHRYRPHFGVQYHPESVATGFGEQLLRNFTRITVDHHCQRSQLPVIPAPAALPFRPPPAAIPPSSSLLTQRKVQTPAPSLSLAWQTIPWPQGMDSQAVFAAMQWSGQQDTFWLDSSDTERARFSFMGGPGGPLWRKYLFKLLPSIDCNSARQPGQITGLLTETLQDGTQHQYRCSLRAWLNEHMCTHAAEDQAELPFDFIGGLVGYLGYEMKAECGGDNTHESPHPDAAFMFADRMLALDHSGQRVYACALHDAECANDAHAWLAAAIAQLQPEPAVDRQTPSADSAVAVQPAARHSTPEPLQTAGVEPPPSAAPPPFELRRCRQQYLEDVRACQDALRAGESYEICLTNSMHARSDAADAWSFYKALRRVNPAPYSAWLNLGQGNPAVCCSSPERFLRLDRKGMLEARPIKGTTRRRPHDAEADAAAAARLAASEKDRAENLMIVDLLRNDLGRVCMPGSVHVPGLMEVESFASVHQLVSTVRGQRDPGCSAVDMLFAAFPGGSMTGAPKIRSMRIIDELEGAARGIYSGCLGYFSANGTFDFNIVIRTAVFDGQGVSIGAGGAIIVQSEAEAEFEEMELKAERLVQALGAM